MYHIWIKTKNQIMSFHLVLLFCWGLTLSNGWPDSSEWFTEEGMFKICLQEWNNFFYLLCLDPNNLPLVGCNSRRDCPRGQRCMPNQHAKQMKGTNGFCVPIKCSSGCPKVGQIQYGLISGGCNLHSCLCFMPDLCDLNTCMCKYTNALGIQK